MATGRKINVLVLGGDKTPQNSLLTELKSIGKTELRANAEYESVATSTEDVAKRFDIAMVDAKNGAFKSNSGQSIIRNLAQRLPVLVWLDRDERETARKFLQLGAQEVLIHGAPNQDSLRRIITYATERFEFAKANAYPRDERRRTERRHQDRRRNDRRRDNERDASNTLDRLPMGVILTDAGQRVLLMNTKARSLIKRGLGLRIDPDGKCRAATVQDDKALTGLIREMSDGTGGEFGGALSVTDAEGNHPLSVLVTPAGAHASHKGAALFFNATDDPPPVSVAALQSLYDLTEAEADLVLGLIGGQTLSDLAKSREVSPHTVRSQLKQIFVKTSVKRQSELVKLVLTGPAVLATAQTSDRPPRD